MLLLLYTMATLETMSKKVVQVTAEMKAARTAWDMACRSNASKETQDNLWNYYSSLQKILTHLDGLLKKAGIATLDLERATAWRNTGIYSENFMYIFSLTNPSATPYQQKVCYQEVIEMAMEAQRVAKEKLANIFFRAEPYL